MVPFATRAIQVKDSDKNMFSDAFEFLLGSGDCENAPIYAPNTLQQNINSKAYTFHDSLMDE